MKKTLAALVMLALLLAGCMGETGITSAKADTDSWYIGEIVTFGVYEQDGVNSNGKEDLEWIVLDTDGDNALLITRYVIDWDYFNSENGGGSKSTFSWTNSKIYKWLNGKFKDLAFTAEEQARLMAPRSATSSC